MKEPEYAPVLEKIDQDIEADQQQVQSRGAFSFTHISELLKQPPPLRWLVPEYLLPESSAVLFGDPATGKSLLALRWAVDLALAGEPVVIIAGEGQFGLRRRLKALAQHLGQEDEMKGAPLVISDIGAAFTEPANLNAVIAAIEAQVREHGKPALIIVDTLHRNFGPGDEDSTKDMGQFIRAVDKLRFRFEATVLLVHHTGHSSKNRARGSSSLRGAVDTELRLYVGPGDERILEDTKMKDGAKPKPAGFRVIPITLPWLDENGNPETSVVLAPTNAPVSPTISKATDNQCMGFEALLDALEVNGTTPPEGFPESGESQLPERVVDQEHWRGAFYTRYKAKNPDSKPGSERKAFDRARQDLIDNSAVALFNDLCWPTPKGAPWPELQKLMLPHFLNTPIEPGTRDIGGTLAGHVPPPKGTTKRDGRDTPL